MSTYTDPQQLTGGGIVATTNAGEVVAKSTTAATTTETFILGAQTLQRGRSGFNSLMIDTNAGGGPNASSTTSWLRGGDGGDAAYNNGTTNTNKAIAGSPITTIMTTSNNHQQQLQRYGLGITVDTSSSPSSPSKVYGRGYQQQQQPTFQQESSRSMYPSPSSSLPVSPRRFFVTGGGGGRMGATDVNEVIGISFAGGMNVDGAEEAERYVGITATAGGGGAADQMNTTTTNMMSVADLNRSALDIVRQRYNESRVIGITDLSTMALESKYQSPTRVVGGASGGDANNSFSGAGAAGSSPMDTLRSNAAVAAGVRNTSPVHPPHVSPYSPHVTVVDSGITIPAGGRRVSDHADTAESKDNGGGENSPVNVLARLRFSAQHQQQQQQNALYNSNTNSGAPLPPPPPRPYSTIEETAMVQRALDEHHKQCEATVRDLLNEYKILADDRKNMLRRLKDQEANHKEIADAYSVTIDELRHKLSDAHSEKDTLKEQNRQLQIEVNMLKESRDRLMAYIDESDLERTQLRGMMMREMHEKSSAAANNSRSVNQTMTHHTSSATTSIPHPFAAGAAAVPQSSISHNGGDDICTPYKPPSSATATGADHHTSGSAGTVIDYVSRRMGGGGGGGGGVGDNTSSAAALGAGMRSPFSNGDGAATAAVGPHDGPQDVSNIIGSPTTTRAISASPLRNVGIGAGAFGGADFTAINNTTYLSNGSPLAATRRQPLVAGGGTTITDGLNDDSAAPLKMSTTATAEYNAAIATILNRELTSRLLEPFVFSPTMDGRRSLPTPSAASTAPIIGINNVAHAKQQLHLTPQSQIEVTVERPKIAVLSTPKLRNLVEAMGGVSADDGETANETALLQKLPSSDAQLMMISPSSSAAMLSPITDPAQIVVTNRGPAATQLEGTLAPIYVAFHKNGAPSQKGQDQHKKATTNATSASTAALNASSSTTTASVRMLSSSAAALLSDETRQALEGGSEVRRMNVRLGVIVPTPAAAAPANSASSSASSGATSLIRNMVGLRCARLITGGVNGSSSNGDAADISSTSMSPNRTMAARSNILSGTSITNATAASMLTAATIATKFHKSYNTLVGKTIGDEAIVSHESLFLVSFEPQQQQNENQQQQTHDQTSAAEGSSPTASTTSPLMWTAKLRHVLVTATTPLPYALEMAAEGKELNVFGDIVTGNLSLVKADLEGDDDEGDNDCGDAVERRRAFSSPHRSSITATSTTAQRNYYDDLHASSPHLDAFNRVGRGSPHRVRAEEAYADTVAREAEAAERDRQHRYGRSVHRHDNIYDDGCNSSNSHRAAGGNHRHAPEKGSPPPPLTREEAAMRWLTTQLRFTSASTTNSSSGKTALFTPAKGTVAANRIAVAITILSEEDVPFAYDAPSVPIGHHNTDTNASCGKVGMILPVTLAYNNATVSVIVGGEGIPTTRGGGGGQHQRQQNGTGAASPLRDLIVGGGPQHSSEGATTTPTTTSATTTASVIIASHYALKLMPTMANAMVGYDPYAQYVSGGGASAGGRNVSARGGGVDTTAFARSGTLQHRYGLMRALYCFGGSAAGGVATNGRGGGGANNVDGTIPMSAEDLTQLVTRAVLSAASPADGHHYPIVASTALASAAAQLVADYLRGDEAALGYCGHGFDHAQPFVVLGGKGDRVSWAAGSK